MEPATLTRVIAALVWEGSHANESRSPHEPGRLVRHGSLIAKDASHNPFYQALRAGEHGDEICLIGYIGTHRADYKLLDILIIN